MARSLIGFGCCVLLLASCSSVSTDYDFDDQVDFSMYRSYQWVPSDSESTPNSVEYSQLIDRRIRAAVEQNLAAEGLTPASTAPNLLVAYSTRTDRKTEVLDNGYYGYGYRGWRGSYWRPSTMQVYQYEEGTLVIDLIDAQKKQLVWRGKAVGIVGDYADSENRINEAVKKLFQHYPPPK